MAALVLGAVALWAGKAGPSPEASAQPAGATSIIVTPRPIAQRLLVVGIIEPGGVVNVTAPFDGAIREKLVEFGARVEAGSALLVLDTTEIDLQIREAEAVKIKAEQAVADMTNWNSTPDVMRARNAVTAAQIKIDELTRKEREAETLLSRGIIPRVEHDGIVEQVKAQELQLATAKHDLEAVLRRGDAEHRRLAALELETASRRLAELRRQMDAGLVEAPTAGLLLRPNASAEATGASSPAEIEVGSRVAKGQPLFTIADTDTLRAVARVDEIDVNNLADGMAVEISGDAFGAARLVGRVSHISAQATSAPTRSPLFELIVSMTPPPELRRRIRVGMSANLAIIIYENPAAIVLPPAAIRSGDHGPYAILHDPATGGERQVNVTVGRAVEDGVEITDGLSPGDVVVVAAQANGAGPPLPASGGLSPPPGGASGFGQF